jgi:tetratricopeptide (TPR) repeat protein
MRTALAIAAAWLMACGAVAGAADLSRDQAQQALAKDDAALRREAASRLGDVGTMEDMKLLVRTLRDPDAETRERAERAMWEIWARSGDADVDKLYQTGIAQMNAGELRDAIATFGKVIERKPEFAEGWNKRATLYYLLGDLRRSLADCDETIKRNPYHFGALSGYVLIYVQLEYYDRALEYSRRALEINPNLDRALKERRAKTV